MCSLPILFAFFISATSLVSISAPGKFPEFEGGEPRDARPERRIGEEISGQIALGEDIAQTDLGRVAAADDADLLALQILEFLDLGLDPELEARLVRADEDRLELCAFHIGAERDRGRARELQIARDQRRRRDAAARLHDLDLDAFLREIALIGGNEERTVIHRGHHVRHLYMVEREGHLGITHKCRGDQRGGKRKSKTFHGDRLPVFGFQFSALSSAAALLTKLKSKTFAIGFAGTPKSSPRSFNSKA